MPSSIPEQIVTEQSFPPASKSTEATLYNNAVIGSAVGIDTSNFQEALVVVELGAIAGGGTLTVDLAFGDVSPDATTAVVKSGTTMSIVEGDAGTTFRGRIRVNGEARYMYVKVVEAGAVAKDYSITVLLGQKGTNPATDTSDTAQLSYDLEN